MGGASNEYRSSCYLDASGNYYMVGYAEGTGWPTKNPYQSNFQGGRYDVLFAKFQKT
jgi:hypothetical protein